MFHIFMNHEPRGRFGKQRSGFRRPSVPLCGDMERHFEVLVKGEARKGERRWERQHSLSPGLAAVRSGRSSDRTVSPGAAFGGEKGTDVFKSKRS